MTDRTESTRSNPTASSAHDDMAQPDSDRLPDNELLSLYRDDSSSGSSYVLRRNLRRALRAADMDGVDRVDVLFDDEDPETPALVIVPIDTDDEAFARNPRQIRYVRESAEIRVPQSLLAGGDHPGDVPEDLGLDLDSYGNNDKLLFEPVIGDGLLMLLPVRWESGDPYIPPTLDPEDVNPPTRSSGSVSDSDADADTETDPIPQRTIAETAQSTGVDRDALERVMEDVDRAVDELTWQPPVQHQPLDLDNRVVHIVPPEVWVEIRDHVQDAAADDPGSLEQLLDAAELVHVATAREAIETSDRSDLRHFEAEFSSVIERTG